MQPQVTTKTEGGIAEGGVKFKESHLRIRVPHVSQKPGSEYRRGTPSFKPQGSPPLLQLSLRLPPTPYSTSQTSPTPGVLIHFRAAQDPPPLADPASTPTLVRDLQSTLTNRVLVPPLCPDHAPYGPPLPLPPHFALPRLRLPLKPRPLTRPACSHRLRL